MAIVYKYEDNRGGIFTNGMQFLSGTSLDRVVFNDPPRPLTTTAYSTGFFINTAGAGLSSGAGKIVFDNAYNGVTVYLLENSDRTSFATVLLSAATTQTLTLTANGFNAWGPTERRLRLLEYI